jgi:ubiquinone/menaquinone biosynthesis C-methylase UbiE
MRRYDLTAKIYDTRYAEEQAAKYDAASECLMIGGNVLDVGCGTGLLFKHVAAEADNVVGADVSKQLLFLARERARIFLNVSLVQADADFLPFRDDFFNVVFAFTVLQNMPKPKETLHEIRRVAKCGVPVVVTGLKKAFSLKTYEELLQNAGLRVVSIKDDDCVKCYVAISLKSSE